MNRAFSASALAVYDTWGVAPRLIIKPRLWRYQKPFHTCAHFLARHIVPPPDQTTTAGVRLRRKSWNGTQIRVCSF